MQIKLPFSRLFQLFLILLLAFSVSFSIACSGDKKAEEDGEESSETHEDSDHEDSEEEHSEEKSEESDQTHEKSDDGEKSKDTAHDSDSDSEKSEDKKDGHEKDNKKSNANVSKLWQDLLEGNGRFVAGNHSNGSFVSSRKSLIKGQEPEVIVVSCSDSRVPPELVFDKNLGELFVIRTAGNVLDPIALGSVEYAAEHLHSKMLVVLGHEMCGAVAATLSGDKMPTKNLNAIVSTIRPAFEGSEECKPGSKGGDKCVRLNVTNSAREMVARSPILKNLVADGSLHIVKAVYQMESGKVVRF